jgi:hypothetical protein
MQSASSGSYSGLASEEKLFLGSPDDHILCVLVFADQKLPMSNLGLIWEHPKPKNLQDDMNKAMRVHLAVGSAFGMTRARIVCY